MAEMSTRGFHWSVAGVRSLSGEGKFISNPAIWPGRAGIAFHFLLLLVVGGLFFAPNWCRAQDDAPAADAPKTNADPAMAIFSPKVQEARDLYERMIRDTVPKPVPAEKPAGSGQTLLVLSILVVVGVWAVRKFVPEIPETFHNWLNPPDLAPARKAPRVVAEEQAVSEFLAEFRLGPIPPPSKWPGAERAASSSPGRAAAEAPRPQVDPLKAFLAAAPKQVQGFRKLLQEIGKTSQEAERQSMLNRLSGELLQFKESAGLPQLLPAWQMICALEWLVNQLAQQASRVTPSTLRTVATAVDSLGQLCRPGLRPDLCTNPPMRLLVVDDNAIGRHTLSFALVKGGNQPDLAVDGPAALELAAKQPYDVIFMDVQMPGMDGFEVCSKIRELPLNRTTPVVFVTMQSDFDARAKSTLCGGNDLLGKPFLTFEITVKALTLALIARLRAGDAAAEPSVVQARNSPAVAPALQPAAVPAGT
jgi:CheY-like chemotaxis protein